jgi:uncharacterized phage protein (TIGR02218 family)
MREASAALLAFLAQARAAADAPLLCADCYTFSLRDGSTLAYTNADVPVTLGGAVFLANSVLVDGLRYRCSTGLAVDQQEITVAARATDTIGGVPFLAALRNGVLDGAEVQRERAFLSSWSAPPVGSVLLFKGRVATIDEIGRTSARITVSSDLVLLDVDMPRNLYSPACVHVVFDSGCGLLRNAFSAQGVVGAAPGALRIPWAASSPAYAQGVVLFTSGVNAGLSATIKNADSASLTLSYPLLNQPAAGDTFTATQGCDHTQATCQAKFGNLANFRGFPYVPPPSYAIP